MHHIYHTEGLILGSKNSGETDKYYYIFTRELGMLVATAKGVRKMSSKLRFVLQDFSYLSLDIVSGRNIFRITNALKKDKLENLKQNRFSLRIFVQLSKLLRRLLAGIEPNEILFDDLVAGLGMLENALKKEDATYRLRNIEIIIVLRILKNLGYIGEDKSMEDLTSSPFELMVFEDFKNQDLVIKQINKALKETHL